MSNPPLDQQMSCTSGPLVLMISYDFFPSTQIGARRTSALAKFLVTQGYRVAVISAFGERDVTAGSQIMPGIIAVPLRRPPRILIDSIVTLKRRITKSTAHVKTPSRGASPGRTTASPIPHHTPKETFFRVLCFVDEFKRWSWRASRAAINTAKEYNPALIISSGPPNSALVAGAFAARKLRIPHIADLRDPWTDSITANPRYRIDYLLQRPLEKWVVRTAARITSAGANVANLLATRYPGSRHKIIVVRNGYDGNSVTEKSNTNGKLSILFAGELYLGRNPFPILESLETLL